MPLVTGSEDLRTGCCWWFLQIRWGVVIMAKMVKKDTDKEKRAPVAVNKKAYHDFEFVDKYEAGIELWGSAMKLLRVAPADLTPEPVV